MYRRPMSPYNSRVATYLEALDRDETINTLRREYAHHRTVESEYDDLKFQISKAERENKKLEEKNLEIQEDYMEKIKCNKGLISELGGQIEQIEGKIRNAGDCSQSKQTQNEKLIDQVKQTKIKINQCQDQNKKLQGQISEQEGVIITLTQTLNELMGKKKETQTENKNQSEIIDGEFDEYKSLQDRTKEEELINAELREQLSILKAKKAKFMLKVEQAQEKMKDLKKKFEHAQFQKDKLSARCHETQKESSKVYAEALTLKQNIQQSLTKNKDHTSKLKSLEVVLKENINGLSVKHLTKEKMGLELSELTKDIEKSQALLKNLEQQTVDQEASNKGLIANLKKSIQSDQEAVKALTRKAAILNLISQS